MESQRPEEALPESQEFSFAQPVEEALRLTQPSTSRRHPREKEQPIGSIQRQFEPSQCLVIVLEEEPPTNNQPTTLFKGHFKDRDALIFGWSREQGVGHYCWLRGPMNHLIQER